MFAQRNELQKRLREHGWEIKQIEEWHSGNLDWFLIELWLLESTWTPQGKQVYVSFVLEPQANVSDGKRWKHAYAIKASLQRPTTWGAGENEIELCLNRGWENRLPMFMQGLNALRNCN